MAVRRGRERPLPLQTADACREHFLRRSCALWAKERNSGVSLLRAELRASLTRRRCAS
jgi:hypothetical protein